MRLSQLPRKYHKHIHPSFRVPLLRGQKNRRRIVKRNALQLIRRKYAVLDVKPRIPPLHCARCGLVTRFLSTISFHDCTIKNIYYWRGTGAGACAELNTLGDDEIDEDLLAMGGRNRMRDGMAILERFARPQNVSMYDIDYNEPNKSRIPLPPSTGRSVPTLSELVIKVLAPPRSSFPSLPSDQVFEIKPVQVVSKRPIGRGHRDGHLCPPCGRLFASFDDYDVHLSPSMDEKGEEINPCRRVPPNPIPLLLNDRGNAPPEYDFVSRRSKKIEREYLIDSCTGCGMEGFETTIDLHSHIIECAKKMEYERIDQAVNKRRHLLSKV
ncbi:hypothetical protein PENTCL1PPCAC_6303 [Pristionchus entomophagus]|uniref:C2H2-type domain-containing protein n=1 Tax=Pristionchus entomophagus TaxID=358040 RepID=A0AAV5SPS4_9BILA|nr:hypothetical protein PENTCL1PPCAC_6303 [Pristionchus entomophagus]